MKLTQHRVLFAPSGHDSRGATYTPVSRRSNMRDAYPGKPLARAVSMLAAACGLLLANAPAQALTINATFDSALTAAQQQTITTALNVYEQDFSDPITVSIYFNNTPTSGAAGSSQSGGYNVPYMSTSRHTMGYTNALLNDATANGNTIEQTAYNNLGSGNSADLIDATSADLRALGDSGATGYLNPDGTVGGTYDGVVSIGNNYFTQAVIQHEIDEVLGIGGSGSVLNIMSANNLTSAPTTSTGQTYIAPLDMFRYSSAGTASLTTDGTANSYFSIDGGVTDIVGFNQNSTGDYGDWATGSVCNVQDWTVCSNPQPISLTSPEGIALQAIGYDAVSAVPLPGSLILFASGLIGLAAARRRGAHCAML